MWGLPHPQRGCHISNPGFCHLSVTNGLSPRTGGGSHPHRGRAGFAAEKDNLVCLPLGVLIFRDREWHYSRHTDGENGLLLTKNVT